MGDDAYERAIEFWTAFDEEVDDTLLRAVAGAFALVACADGELAEAEVGRFLALVRGHEALRSVATADLEEAFRALTSAFRESYVLGERKATDVVARVRHDAAQVELVIRGAQIAIVADEVLEEVEEVALQRVCFALGVDPSLY
jgi:tellurite resistance protein